MRVRGSGRNLNGGLDIRPRGRTVGGIEHRQLYDSPDREMSMNMKQIQVKKSTLRRPASPIDLRTPSGALLPY